jgi:hypothetical protein
MGLKRDKQVLLDQIKMLENIRDTRDLDFGEQFWLHLKAQLDELYFEEEKYWCLRAKQQWLMAGDQNTNFFHRIANTRSRKNKILSLEIQRQLTGNTKDIHQHVQEYYKDLLGTPECPFGHLGPGLWAPQDKVTSEENTLLISPFLESEIHRAIFESDPNGSPGPYGLTFKFYQFFWKTIKGDLFRICQHFQLGDLELQFLNKSVICLIPKEPEAQVIKKVRPISLVNCSFKILSKILTFRI